MSRVCPSWLSFILYNPVRKKFTDRRHILHESSIAKDSVVLEVGAGNGFLTEVIADYAKKVIVVELQDEMVKKLKKRISGLDNKIDIITADIASYNTEAFSADVCLLYYCFHEFANKPDAVKNIAKAIKSRGILSIYEPKVEVGKKDMIQTIRMFEDAGFDKEQEYKSLFTRFVRMRKRD